MDSAAFLYLSNVLVAASCAALIWLSRRLLKRFFGRWLDQGSGAEGQSSQVDLGLIAVASGTALGALLSMIGIPLVAAVALGGMLALVIPGVVARRRRQMYVNAFEGSLVESLTTMASSLKAGLTLKDALLVAANNCPPAFARETSTALKEYHFGLPIDEALDGIRQRIQTPNASIGFGAMIIASRLGGNLPEILGRIVRTVRERERVEGKLKALTAQGRAQAFILCAAPPGIGVLMYFVDPEKMRLFTTMFAGQLLMTAAIVLEVIGIIVTRRIMRIDI